MKEQVTLEMQLINLRCRRLQTCRHLVKLMFKPLPQKTHVPFRSLPLFLPQQRKMLNSCQTIAEMAGSTSSYYPGYVPFVLVVLYTLEFFDLQSLK